MKIEGKILTAFILNLFFSVFEFIGGIFTGSVAIMSDALHDLGDAASIGISLFLEKRSRREADDSHTFGYMRYSVLGGAITTLILILGSCIVIYKSLMRIIEPAEINYNGMIIFAIVGVIVNLTAAYFTHGGHSVNQRAVNLHMLEDVLGWIVVLIGAIVMKFTDIGIIDPVMSIAVACFILINCMKNMGNVLNIFLERVPEGYSSGEIREHIADIDGVLDVHCLHIWTLDGNIHFASMHIVSDEGEEIKEKIRQELAEHGIVNSTIETESSDHSCSGEVYFNEHSHAGHHHHH